MRWIFFLVLAWLLTAVQSTVGGVLSIELGSIGTIAPDMLASLAVFAALYVRRATDAMLAAFVLGLALDLTTSGAGGAAAVVGPMAIGYALAAKVVFELGEAFFRQRASTRIFMTGVFCIIAHVIWVTAQLLLAYKLAAWSDYGRMLLQAVGISAYSAVVAPFLIWVFVRFHGLLLSVPIASSRRRRR